MSVCQVNSEIDANSYIHPSGRMVDSAVMLANEVSRQMASQQSATVSFRNLRGVSSSYFNTLLLKVGEAHGVIALTRISFHFASAAQKEIFQRSYDAVRRSLSGK